MKSNLFYKIFATYIVIILLSMVVVSFLTTRQIKERLMKQIETNLTTYSGMIDLACTKEDIRKKLDHLSKITDARITLIDATGTVLIDSEAKVSEMDNHLNRTEIQEARIKGKGTSKRYSQTLQIDTLYVALPVREGPEIKGYIRLSRPLTEIRNSIRQFNWIIFQSILLLAALSFVIAFIFSARLVSPIQEMEQFTQKLRDGEISGTLLIDSSDEVGRLARNINFMVTELREKVHSANEEKGKLEAAFASMTDAVLVLDSQGRIEALNKSFKSIFGVRRRDILSRTPLEAFRNIELQNALEQFKEAREPISQEISLGGENGSILDVNISSIEGLPRGEEKTMIVFHDVTRLKKLEKMRVDFVANVSHEIKTPLTAILGFIETLQDGAIEEEETARKFLQTIGKHAERLNRLVDDLLELSDIELGETRLFFESVSVSGVLDSVLYMIEPRASHKALTIEKNIPDDLSPINVDRDKLNQILLNVLDNAVKFTPESESISVAAFDVAEGYVVVEIKDTGIGIPKDEIPRLGERFYRVDKTRSRELGGTGLGLSIVKHLMIAHNGKIEIASQLGIGTTVSLYFPVYKGEDAG
jgi:two-component system phosphate regulon sensor histidine kinase PhoR